MIGHAASTLPDELIPGTAPTAARAAVIGNPVTTTNLHILDRGGPSGGAFRAVREVDCAEGFIHVSPFEPELPQVSKDYPQESAVPAPAPAARRLIQEPDGLTRVMVSANSRGVQRNDGSNGRSANYADGFLDVLRDRAAGVLLRPLTLNRHPWFTFNATGGAPGDTAPSRTPREPTSPASSRGPPQPTAPAPAPDASSSQEPPSLSAPSPPAS